MCCALSTHIKPVKNHVRFFGFICAFIFASCVDNPAKTTDQGRFTNTQTTPPTTSSFTFATINNLSTVEGVLVYSNNLSCSSTESTQAPYFGLVSVTPSSLNCRIDGSSAPFRIKCSPPTKTGHEDQSGTVKVNCTIDDVSVSQSFTVTVSDVNAAPSLATPSSQSVFATEAISTVNINDGTDDYDSDNDPITFSCTFTGGAFGSSTNCSSLPGSVSFSTSTGVLDWTPSRSAPVGGVKTTFTITIVGSDDQTPAKDDTISFKIDVDIVANPTFSSFFPASPNNTSSSPKVIGSSSSNTQTVDLYTDASCSTRVGTGAKSDFEGSGITATLNPNTTASIYAKAFDSLSHSSECTLMGSYTHDDIGPSSPTFVSTNPASPSNGGTTILTIGTSSSDTTSITLYADSSCSGAAIGTGSKANFEGAGISTTVTSNTTTTIYAQASDQVGNLSACTLMTSFIHDTVAPNDPTFLSATPSSPSNTSSSPAIVGTASIDTNTVILYSDASCSTNIGSGTRADFVGAGVTATASTNSTTTIYGKSFDDATNGSNCVLLTSYVHDNVAPAVPAFASFNPSSPNTSSTPLVIGTLAVDVTTINLYKDASCSIQIGTGTDVSYEGGGISASVSPDTTTSVYGKSYDAAGNASACTLLGSYLNDQTIPSAPATVMDGTYYYLTTNTPTLSWSAGSDGGSGISHYEASVGTSAGATDIVAWSNVGNVTSTSFGSLSLGSSTTYYTNVKTVDLVGLASSVTSSDGWTVDTTAPSSVTVTLSDCTQSSLIGSWTSSSDAESGIGNYQYAIGTTAGGTEVVGWTNVSSATTSINRNDLSLSLGTTHYLSVAAVNGAGQSASVQNGSFECDDLTYLNKSFWELDEVSGSRSDSVGTHNLTDNNTVTQNTGVVDNAVSFDPLNSEYLSVATHSDFELNDEDFTVSLWVYLNDNLVDAPLILKWGGSTNEYYFDWVQSTSELRWRVGASGSLVHAISLSTATWYHIVVYHDSVNDTLGIIVNNGTPTTGSYALGSTSGDSDLTIGGDPIGLVYLNGRLDAVGLWKRVLTSKEIGLLYNTGVGVEPPF